LEKQLVLYGNLKLVNKFCLLLFYLMRRWLFWLLEIFMLFKSLICWLR